MLIADAFRILSEANEKIASLGDDYIEQAESPKQPKTLKQLIRVRQLYNILMKFIFLNDAGTAITGTFGENDASLNRLLLQLKRAADIASLPVIPNPIHNFVTTFADGSSGLPTPATEGSFLWYHNNSWTEFLASGNEGDTITMGPTGPVWSSAVGNGIPSGGTTGQFLRKTSNTSFVTAWQTLTLSEVTDVLSSAAEVNILNGVNTGSIGADQINTLVGINTGLTIQAQFNAKLGTTLNSGQFIVGNGSNVATAVTPTGDVTFNNAGLFAITAGAIVDADINASAAITRTKIAAGTAGRIVVNHPTTGLLSEAGAIVPDRVLVSDANGLPTNSDVTTTQLTFYDISSSLQDSLDARLVATITSPAQGDMLVYNGTTWINFAIGADGYALVSNGAMPVWSASSGGLPIGGTTNQYLRKIDATNYNAEWHTFVLADVTDLTVSAAELNLLQGLTVDATDLNFSDGLTDNIQVQINSKLNNQLNHHAIWIGGAGDTAQQVGPGSENSVLTIIAGHPTWQNPPAPGNVSGPVSSTDNAIVRWNGTSGDTIQDSGVTVGDTGNMVFPTGAFIQTSTSAGNTLAFQAYDVDGAAYVTFATLTANNTPTFDLSTNTTIGTAYPYRVGGTDVSLADGGTGTSLADPGGHRFLGWDDTDNLVVWITIGSGLTYDHATHTVTASGGSGTVTGPGSSTDNALVRWDSITGTVVQNSVGILSDTGDMSGIATLTINTTGAIRSATGAGNTLLIQAYDVDGTAYTTWATLTANNTPTFDINTATTIGTAYIYRVGGNDVSLADGGTGASLADPNADRIMFWDDSAGQVTWLAPDSSLSISGTTFSIATNGVANTHFRQSAALSVVGRASNSTGNVADIASSASGDVLKRSGTSLVWGFVPLANGSGTTASVSTSAVNLGGTQTANVDIAAAGFEFNVTNAGAMHYQAVFGSVSLDMLFGIDGFPSLYISASDESDHETFLNMSVSLLTLLSTDTSTGANAGFDANSLDETAGMGVTGASGEAAGIGIVPTAITVSAFGSSFVGVVYDIDYRANYTSRTLPDWGNVTSQLGGINLHSSVTAPTLSENGYFVAYDIGAGGQYKLVAPPSGGTSYSFISGLTNTSGTVTWGGTLNADTTIDGNHQVRFGMVTPISSFYVQATGTSGVVSIVGDTLITIGFNDGTNDIEFSGTQTTITSNGFTLIGSSSSALFTDNRATKAGLQYNADYSANFTTLSLTHQGYVLGAKTYTGKQTFTPGSTNSGLNTGATTANPSSPVNGDIYYNSSVNELRARINGAWIALGAGGGSGLTDGDKGDITVSSSGTIWTIDNDVVTYAKMQNVSATNRFLGRITSGAGDTEELTGTQATTLLDAFTSSLKGLVPASGGGTTNFIRADGTWTVPQSYNRIQEDGTNLTQQFTLNFVGTALTATNDAGNSRTNVTVNTTLQAFADFNTNGILTQTAAATFTGRTIQGTSGNISVTNGDGVAGDPTIDVSSNVVLKNQANAYTAGMKQTVSHSATTAGFNIGPVAGAPSSLANGDFWYNSTLLDAFIRINGVSVSLTRTIIEDVPGTTYPITEADFNKILRATNVLGCTFTIPTGLSNYFACIIYRASGAGTVTISSSGTMESAGGTNPTLDIEKTEALIYHRGSNIHVVTGAVGGGSVSGSGTSGYVAYWNGSTSLSGEAGFEYDSSNNRLTVNEIYLGANTSGNKSITVQSSSTNADMNLIPKGSGVINFGGTASSPYMDGASNALYEVGIIDALSQNLFIRAGHGSSGAEDGLDIHMEPGDAYASSGNGRGGDLLLYGGAPHGTGRYGITKISQGGLAINKVSGSGGLTTQAVLHTMTGSGGSISLPLISSVLEGTLFIVKNKGTGTYTINRAGADTIYSTSAVTSIDVVPGQSLMFINDASHWVVQFDTPLKYYTVAVSDETTALTTGTGKVTFRMPHAMLLVAVRASLTTAQTANGGGGIFTVDINEGGTTILSTKLTIDNTERTSTTAATAAVISDTSLADDAEMSIDIDQIGDGTAKGLKITFIGY